MRVPSEPHFFGEPQAKAWDLMARPPTLAFIVASWATQPNLSCVGDLTQVLAKPAALKTLAGIAGDDGDELAGQFGSFGCFRTAIG